MEILDEIRESIKKIEEKNYEIDKILLSEEILQLFIDGLNKIYGDNSFEFFGLNKVFGYDAVVNYIDDRPVVFKVSIGIENILKGDNNE